MSNSVSKALELIGSPETEKAAEFTLMFDKFFYCKNMSNFTCGRFLRNAFKSPYYSAEDFTKHYILKLTCSYVAVRL